VNEDDNSTTIGWVEHDGPAWKQDCGPVMKSLNWMAIRSRHFAPPSRDSVTWRIITSKGQTFPSTTGAMASSTRRRLSR